MQKGKTTNINTSKRKPGPKPKNSKQLQSVQKLGESNNSTNTVRFSVKSKEISTSGSKTSTQSSEIELLIPENEREDFEINGSLLLEFPESTKSKDHFHFDFSTEMGLYRWNLRILFVIEHVKFQPGTDWRTFSRRESRGECDIFVY